MSAIHHANTSESIITIHILPHPTHHMVASSP